MGEEDKDDMELEVFQEYINDLAIAQEQAKSTMAKKKRKGSQGQELDSAAAAVLEAAAGQAAGAAHSPPVIMAIQDGKAG
eukprot:8124376-Heterocapsa_arctica.AAC.1